MTRVIEQAAPHAGSGSHTCWVGSTDSVEMRHLWGWCKRTLAATHRDSLLDLAAHPIAGLHHVLVARTRRTMLDAQAWSAAARLHPLARWATLSGRLCEGEGRTGSPWSGFQRLRTVDGTAGIRSWLEVAGDGHGLSPPPLPVEHTGRGSGPVGALAPPLRVGLLATQFRFVEHVEELIRDLGGVALWSRPGRYARLRGVSALVIDDSAVCRFLADAAAPPRDLELPPRIAVIASLPCPIQTTRWRAAGIHAVFPKPYRTEHLLGWLAAFGRLSRERARSCTFTAATDPALQRPG